MIKPSTASPASLVASRPAAATEPESRAVEREGEKGGFAEAMGAQGPRDDTDACRDRTSKREEGNERDESTDATATPSVQSSPASAPAAAPTGHGSDPMLGLCTTQAAESSPAVGSQPTMAQEEAAARPSPPAALAIAEPGAAVDARELLEGELQSRIALGGVSPSAVAGAALEGTRGTSMSGSLDVATGASVAVNPSGAAAEIRATERTSVAQPAQATGRPPDLRAPLGSTAWADELGARVTWMVDRGEQVASLRLSPENLGPVEVRIAVREGETSVWFGATHADTRAALEQSLPRLREMLGASGLSLADAGVFSHTPRDPQRGFTSAALARAAQESGADPAGGIVMQVSRRGLVDLYA